MSSATDRSFGILHHVKHSNSNRHLSMENRPIAVLWPEFYPDNIVMSFEAVDFQLVPNQPNFGTFSLLCSDSNYSFEWHPTSPRSLDPPRDTVTLPLSQISEILLREVSCQEYSLTFIQIDSTRVGRFVFAIFPQLQLHHLIEFLLFKQLIEWRDRNKLRYRVLDRSSQESHSIFDYKALSSLDPESAAMMTAHEFVLTQKLQFQGWSAPIEPISRDQWERIPWSELKSQVFTQGFDPELRPFAWARILGVLPHSNDPTVVAEYWERAVCEYRRLCLQLELLTDHQRSAGVSSIQDILKVIDQDVRRNDRILAEFRSDDSPAADVLRHVLAANAIYDHDTGYVQGMTDIASPFVLLFIREWRDQNTAVMFDGSVRSRIEVEAFIFVAYRQFMKLTGHDRLFIDISKNEGILLDHAKAIASFVHTKLGELLSIPDLSAVSFMFRAVLLLFKRESIKGICLDCGILFLRLMLLGLTQGL
jgi:hypothetical protein